MVVKNNKIQLLSDFILEFVKYFEDYLEFMEISESKACSLDRMFMVSSISAKKNQYVISECFESSNSQTFIINARNTFESYCNFLSKLTHFSNHRAWIEN